MAARTALLGAPPALPQAPSPAPRRASARRWLACARALTVLAVALALAVSPPLLDSLGVGYTVPGGSPLTKFHPATAVALAALAAALIAHGRPLRALLAVAGCHPGLAFFFLTWACLFAYNALVQGLPVSTTVDTFLLPMALLALLGDAPEGTRVQVALVVHAAFALNALVALAEAATGWRLVPLALGTTELTWDWRPSAILGHPLANAAATASYLLVLALGGRLDRVPAGIAGGVRAALVALQGCALLAFGGRAALAVTAAILALRGGFVALALLRGRRVDLRAAIAAALLVPAGAALLAAAVARGALDRVAGRFVDDSGSAATRSVLLGFFDHLTPEDVLLGPNQELIRYLQLVEGTEFGIENFWISFVLSYGALVSVVFFAGLFAFLAELARATRPASLAVILANIAIATTSLSYGAKTLMLAWMTVLLLALMPRGRASDRASDRASTPTPGQALVRGAPGARLGGAPQAPATARAASAMGRAMGRATVRDGTG